ncbi:MAG: hypothetical protein WBM90_12035 [Acidimicrobiia bacterium]
MTSQIENEASTRQAAPIGGITCLIIFAQAILASFIAIEEPVVTRRPCGHKREHRRFPGPERKMARQTHVRAG